MGTKHLAHREQTEPPSMNHSHTRSQTMAALAAAEPAGPSSGIRALIRRRPLAAYLLMANILIWLSTLPAVFINAALWQFPGHTIATLLALALPAFLVTAVAEGRAGVRALLARALRWRVGLRWYALALLGIPVGTLLLATTFLGAASLQALADKWPLLVTVFLPEVLTTVVTAHLLEELGWTGFVQHRLQGRHRALPASLLVALAFALFHVPNYFIGAPLTGEQALIVLVQVLPAAMIFAVFFRVLATWLYNSAGQSVLIVALLHAVLNALASARVGPEFVPHSAASWLPYAVVAGLAVLAAVATRGRLAHTRDDGSTQARRLAPAAALPTRPTLG